jgi:subtilisin family serine protease
VRQKPDITAADGVSTATPGFNPFPGTSAAAPHATAIAGLMLSFDPGLDTVDVRDVFNQTALDIEAPGVDRDSGVGIVDAFAALGTLPEPPPPPSPPNDLDDPTLLVTPLEAYKPKGRFGGPFKPRKKIYTLTNTGDGTLLWTASKDKNWVKVLPKSGALDAGQSASVTVKLKKRIVNRKRARKRRYKAKVFFTNATNGMGSTVRRVKLKVKKG